MNGSPYTETVHHSSGLKSSTYKLAIPTDKGCVTLSMFSLEEVKELEFAVSQLVKAAAATSEQ